MVWRPSVHQASRTALLLCSMLVTFHDFIDMNTANIGFTFTRDQILPLRPEQSDIVLPCCPVNADTLGT